MIHHTVTRTAQAKTRGQRGKAMGNPQIAIEPSSHEEECSLVGSGIESFQFFPVHLSLDVPQAEIGDSIGSVSALQQPCLAQYLGSSTGMVFTDRDVSACCPWPTLEFPILVSAIKTQQRSISRVEPRSSGEHVQSKFVAENPNSYAVPFEGLVAQYEVELSDSFIREYTEQHTQRTDLLLVEGDRPDETV
jgi:hypothetical protein